MILEAGYIGRKISNEFQEINIDAVPWMTTLGGQSFAQAYASVYTQICGLSVAHLRQQYLARDRAAVL